MSTKSSHMVLIMASEANREQGLKLSNKKSVSYSERFEWQAVLELEMIANYHKMLLQFSCNWRTQVV